MTKPDPIIMQQSDNGRIGIAWRPDDEAGGCEVLKWVPDDMIKKAYAHIIASEV